MPKILLSNHYDEEVFQIVKESVPDGFEIEMLDAMSRENFIEKVRDADYILASGRMKIDNYIITAAKRLKMIQRTGVGIDSLDLESLCRHGIPVYVNAGVNAVSVAEHTILLMLASLRNLIQIDAQIRSGKWEKQKQGIRTYELYDKTVGLIGAGNIGLRVAERLKCFGTKVIYYSIPRLSREEELRYNMTYCSLDMLLQKADVISLHCPLMKETKHMIGVKELQKMKSSAVLVNTSRGGLVDQEALIQALQTRKISMAALDVYEEEPIPEECELKIMKNVILTPHIGGVTYDSYRNMIDSAMQNIRLFEQGNLVEIEKNKLSVES